MYIAENQSQLYTEVPSNGGMQNQSQLYNSSFHWWNAKWENFPSGFNEIIPHNLQTVLNLY